MPLTIVSIAQDKYENQKQEFHEKVVERNLPFKYQVRISENLKYGLCELRRPTEQGKN